MQLQADLQKLNLIRTNKLTYIGETMFSSPKFREEICPLLGEIAYLKETIVELEEIISSTKGLNDDN